MEDINGIELQEGDRVVMAVTQYESPRMVKGTIVKIAMRKPRRRDPQLCVTIEEDGGRATRWTFTPQKQILKV